MRMIIYSLFVLPVVKISSLSRARTPSRKEKFEPKSNEIQLERVTKENDTCEYEARAKKTIALLLWSVLWLRHWWARRKLDSRLQRDRTQTVDTTKKKRRAKSERSGQLNKGLIILHSWFVLFRCYQSDIYSRSHFARTTDSVCCYSLGPQRKVCKRTFPV